MIIGITGKSGSGKSYISEKLTTQLNAIHVEIDKVSHDVLYSENSKPFLKEEFGEAIFENGVLNRKQLGKIVFDNKEKLTKLNQFCQTKMEEILDETLENNLGKTIILDYALLPWLKQFEVCDVKILVTSSFEDRFSRAAKRENITKEYYQKRDASLKGYDDLVFDITINNSEQIDFDALIKTIQTYGEKHD